MNTTSCHKKFARLEVENNQFSVFQKTLKKKNTQTC